VKLKPENHIKVNAEVIKEDGRDFARLTYQNASIKKQIPSHLKKMTPEDASWHVELIFRELHKKLGRKLGINFTQPKE
jgi:hypothetical protein